MCRLSQILRGLHNKINVEEWNLKTEPSSEDPLAWEHLAEDETKTLLHQAVDSLPKETTHSFNFK